jgi:putative addiction module component (TIGR02574 family)
MAGILPPEEVAMIPTLQALGLDRLSLDERLAVAEASPLTPAQRAELERRLADRIARPEAVIPWEQVKARALARAKQ